MSCPASICAQSCLVEHLSCKKAEHSISDCSISCAMLDELRRKDWEEEKK